MKNLILTLAVVVFSLHSANAQWWTGNKKIEGNGNFTSETRNVSEYDEVALQGFMDVRLVAGNEGALKIEAESNLMEYILTEVRNGKLKIYIEEGINLDPSRGHDILITVPFRSLEVVSLTGSGDIISSDLIKARNFDVQVTGSGDITLNLDAQKVSGTVTGSGDISLDGTAKEFDCRVTGSGDFDASGFRAQIVSATVSGSGDINVYASEYLKSRISGSGDIRYSGKPQKQDFKTSGSGSVSGR